jgi:hypothetical protein
MFEGDELVEGSAGFDIVGDGDWVEIRAPHEGTVAGEKQCDCRTDSRRGARYERHFPGEPGHLFTRWKDLGALRLIPAP